MGMTESGKSCFGKILCRALHEQGKPVAVLDPLLDPDWTADIITDDIEDYSRYLEQHRSVYGFVDECGTWFNEGNDTTNAWLATRSRHYGHSMVFIAQRAIQIPKTMRDQCSRLYLFTSSKSDGKIHSEEWNKEALEGCNTLEQFAFFKVDRYHTCDLLRVEDYERVCVGRPSMDRAPKHSNRNIRNGNKRGSMDRQPRKANS